MKYASFFFIKIKIILFQTVHLQNYNGNKLTAKNIFDETNFISYFIIDPIRKILNVRYSHFPNATMIILKTPLPRTSKIRPPPLAALGPLWRVGIFLAPPLARSGGYLLLATLPARCLVLRSLKWRHTKHWV